MGATLRSRGLCLGQGCGGVRGSEAAGRHVSRLHCKHLTIKCTQSSSYTPGRGLFKCHLPGLMMQLHRKCALCVCVSLQKKQSPSLDGANVPTLISLYRDATCRGPQSNTAPCSPTSLMTPLRISNRKMTLMQLVSVQFTGWRLKSF